ncbi:MAG: copper chaperone [Nitrospiraceae bacterium]|nr:MAG: copper chaperone [Nitrospiraceae bacterium]
MAEITIKIEGMSCQHCVMSVKKGVDSIDGVTSSNVVIGSARVVYDSAKTNADVIAAAVRKAGYKTTGAG